MPYFQEKLRIQLQRNLPLDIRCGPGSETSSHSCREQFSLQSLQESSPKDESTEPLQESAIFKAPIGRAYLSNCSLYAEGGSNGIGRVVPACRSSRQLKARTAPTVPVQLSSGQILVSIFAEPAEDSCKGIISPMVPSISYQVVGVPSLLSGMTVRRAFDTITWWRETTLTAVFRCAHDGSIKHLLESLLPTNIKSTGQRSSGED